MIKAAAKGADGRDVLLIGLSHANLDRLRADGLDGAIKIEAKDGWPVTILITAAPTEADIANALIGSDLVGPDTKINIDPKLKT